MSDAARIIEDDGVPLPGERLVEERFEFVYGTTYAMSSPSAVHQHILLKVAAQLAAFFEGKPCTPYTAPFDVYPLVDSGDDDTLVQPDIFMVCDKDRLKMDGYYGSPPLVIEILSQNRSHDLVLKLNLYHKAGVAEYIVIDPIDKMVFQFIYGADAYTCKSFQFTEKIFSQYFNSLALDLSFPLPFESAS